jgi:hypothetical protein
MLGIKRSNLPPSCSAKKARAIAAAWHRKELKVVESIFDAPEFLPVNELTAVALVIEIERTPGWLHRFRRLRIRHERRADI